MFGWFKKKENKIPVSDRVWMHATAKWNARLEQDQRDSHTIFLGWFEESRHNLQHYLESRSVTDACISGAQFPVTTTGDSNIVFIEHHPVQQEEQHTFAAMGLKQAVVYSSLDEALFALFGGDRIIQMIQNMGMKEDEMIAHSLITAAIGRAQEKIVRKTILSGPARSQSDWLLNAGITQKENY